MFERQIIEARTRHYGLVRLIEVADPSAPYHPFRVTWSEGRSRRLLGYSGGIEAFQAFESRLNRGGYVAGTWKSGT